MTRAEDAEVVVAAEGWVVHRRFALIGAEAGEQGGVGTELLRAAMQLACVAQIDQAALVHAVDGAAQFNVLAAQCIQIARVARVLGQAGDGEAAVGIAGLGAAGVEEARAVAQLRDVIDVRGHADVFAGVAGGFRRGVTDARPRVKRGAGNQKQAQNESRTMKS